MAELYTLKPIFQGSSETDQLFKICSVLGTPGPNNWPDGVKYATRLGIRLPQFATTPLASIIPNASPEAIDLISNLLKFDPSKRPSASQALQHDFFKGPKVSVMNNLSTNQPSAKLPQTKATQIQHNQKMADDEAQRIHVRSYEPRKAEQPKKVFNSLDFPPANDDDDFDDIIDGIL